ncbi:hypothetical protein [Nonomuraea aridisoli]|uniref:Aminoglycoside phosphotransferase domain-containing protein n=1 Tax=Nonomuraea aridisoli TaxID=2070368 RepID=A0A2W2ENQ4_9ACTN|nr:hypothetical protein [Nonomuraea aridisoli]PZG18389.1 hypothetical protein C1J01_15255 [Nonomuraea aridisoli]
MRMPRATGGRTLAWSARAPAVAAFHRREAAISERLPAHAPVPRLLGTYDDGDWIALAFEEIDGRLPAQPWHDDELQRVLETAGPRIGSWSSTGRTRGPEPVL